MSMSLALARRFANTPLALWEARAPAMLEGLRAYEEPPAMVEGKYSDARPYDVIDGVGIVPIRGVLLHGDCYWWDTMSYDAIGRCLAQAIADPEVRGIALHVNSPGGEVAGCFDLADKIYEMRGAKPICAILDECAYSAAYALACAADTIVVPRTGGTGSIGVITMHVDMTKALEQWGIKVTTIKYGALKDASYPTTPLSDENRDRMQVDIDMLGEMFCSMVARNRGLSVDAVREMQAGTFLGDAGVKAGLANEVMAPADAFLKFVAQVA